MATFVMQALGCEVSAINTVQFSALSQTTTMRQEPLDV
jgi:pyridoxal/pyridoxine/pyridoxamine kinase